MAIYDGTFHVIDGKRQPATRAGRFRKSVLRAVALQRLKLACQASEMGGRLKRFAQQDFGRTADDLTQVARCLERLAAHLYRLVRDDCARTGRDLASCARSLGYLARDLASLARRLQIQASDEFSRTARHVARAAIDTTHFVRDGLRRVARNFEILSERLATLAREDYYRTADDLTRLASRTAILARHNFERTIRDLASLARVLARLARDGFRKTVGHLRQLALFSMAVARHVAATMLRLCSYALRLSRQLAARLGEEAGRLKIRVRIGMRQLAALCKTLAALPRELLGGLQRAAHRVVVPIGLGIRRTGGEFARAGAELGQQAGGGCRTIAGGILDLARLSVRLTHHAAGRGRNRYEELVDYLKRGSEDRRQAREQRASVKAAERRTKLQLAEQQAMLKMAERQAKLEKAGERARAIAEQQAKAKIAEQEAKAGMAAQQAIARMAEQEAKAKRVEAEKEAALARKKAAEQASTASSRRAPETLTAARLQEASADRPRRVLILVENLPSPFDRRVWQEANALRDAGYLVSIICPTGKGYEKKFEDIDGIHIWRYDLPFEANGALGYLAEYATAITRTWILAWRVFFGRGFDAIHACNPPDLLFLIGAFFKLLGRKFLFDHHDINPELYEAKFGRRDFFYQLLLRFERWSFRAADVSIATNESYRRIAIERGGMPPERVFVVRSGPSLQRMKIVPADERLKRGRRYLVGYVGVMGKQEGIDCLLRAVRLIVCRHGRTDIHFGLVGGGTSLEEMKALAERLGIADYVTFTGRVPDAELLTMLNTAEVCVNPDIASEMNDKSTMNKIMEYMALGKPIVQFDLTEGRYSARGAALNARRGDIADFAARILELVDNPELRARMGAAGRERVLNALSWDHEVPRLLAAYECLWDGDGKTLEAGDAGEAMSPLGTPSTVPPAGTL